MDRDEIAQHNSRVLQEAGEARTLGIETGPIDTDTLPFLRDEDGQTPLAPLFTISRSASRNGRLCRLLPATRTGNGYRLGSLKGGSAAFSGSGIKSISSPQRTLVAVVVARTGSLIGSTLVAPCSDPLM